MLNKKAVDFAIFQAKMAMAGFETKLTPKGEIRGSVEPCRAKDRKFKGVSGAIFSSAHYYVNADGFIACRLGGAIVDIKDKS